MQIVKVKYSVENMISLHKLNDLTNIKFTEVIEIYHYNRRNFYTLNRITLKTYTSDPEKFIRKVFNPVIYQTLEQKGNEVLCIMTQRSQQGFWPKFLSGPWVIIPPIYIDENFISHGILIKDSFEQMYKKITKIIPVQEIIAINTAESFFDTSFQTRIYQQQFQPIPHFPIKQREVALFATRHGYYQSPKKISAKQIANHFKISVSAVNEHLRKAERTVMKYFFS